MTLSKLKQSLAVAKAEILAAQSFEQMNRAKRIARELKTAIRVKRYGK